MTAPEDVQICLRKAPGSHRAARDRRPLRLFGWVLGLLVSACGVPMERLPLMANEDAAFRAYLDESWEQDLALSPMFASQRGVKTYQDRWTPVDEAHYDRLRELYEQRRLDLAQFDRAALSPSARLSYDIYALNLDRRLAADEFRHHRFVITQHRGPHTSVPSDLINIHQVTDVADAQAYIARLRNVEEYFDGVVEQLRIRAQKDLWLAAWQYPPIIEAARNVISGAPFDEGPDSSIWADFQGKVHGLALDDGVRSALLEDGRLALENRLRPAYERLITVLEEYALRESDDDGVWKFADGDAFYAERLRWYTTTDLTADQVHQLGLQEVARIHNEMRAIMASVGFAGELADFFRFMRDDPQFYFADDEQGRAAYLEEARALIDAMRAALPSAFGLLPRADIVVKRVEPFRERSAGKAFYQSPPEDGSRPGIYYANLYDMTSMPRYQMAALAFHEGVPGHHMQRAIAAELTSIPPFQKYASFTVFTEGWALYSETLAGEMGFYRDPYADFGRLAMELWRACRLVVDTGLHSKRWTRAEARAYLTANTPNSEGDVNKAIDRYIAQPGQATAYMIGKLRILALRERAREAIGEDFDLRAFHDEVLRDGPVPLSVLETKIDGFIARYQASSPVSP